MCIGRLEIQMAINPLIKEKLANELMKHIKYNISAVTITPHDLKKIFLNKVFFALLHKNQEIFLTFF